MTKTQRLRNMAEGFMGGLVAAGFQGPWRWAHYEWEGAFYRVWNAWAPHSGPEFSSLAVGGSADGRTSQARDILFQLKSTSPFASYKTAELTTRPFGLQAQAYLEIWCKGATPREWTELAAAFLAEMEAVQARRESRG